VRLLPRAAYPPGLLPAPSWQRVMGNLSKHYGTDASLDAATVQELTGWLTAQRRRQLGQARPGGAAAGPHHTQCLVRARTRRAAPCHLEAAGGEEPVQLRRLPHPRRQGSYREREIRIPR
jgi:hypothetical protein